MTIRMSIARCCCTVGPPTPEGCNPEGTIYDSTELMTDSVFTVDTNKIGWKDVLSDRGTPYPWSPSMSWVSNGFGGYFPSYPLGTFWDANTLGGAFRIDFSTSGNLFEMYGAIGSMQTRHSDSANGGNINLTQPLWNPCDHNTIDLAFTHGHNVTIPSGGWGSPTGVISSPVNRFKLVDWVSDTSINDFLDIQTFIDYDRDADTYANKVVVTKAGMSPDTYTFGTSSTSSAACTISLVVTPVARTGTANRWNMEFNIVADGTTLVIPDYVFSLRTTARFGVSQYFEYAENRSDKSDKYAVEGLSLGLSDTVIP